MLVISMTQTLLTSYLNKTSSKPSKARKYQDIVDELVKEAEEAFEAKKMKVSSKKKSTTVDSQETPPKPVMSYKKYTLRQKQAIVALASYISYADIERKFGVDESTTRNWVKFGVKEDGRKSNGKAPKALEFERMLTDSLNDLSEKGGVLTSKVIFKEAKVCFMKKYEVTEEEYKMLQNYAKFCAKNEIYTGSILYRLSSELVQSFDKDGKEVDLMPEEVTKLRDSFIKVKDTLIILDDNWLHRYTSRNGFKYRKITHYTPKLFSDLQQDIVSFLEDIHNLRKQHNIPPELLLNFDETAVYYDTLPTYSYFKT